MTTPNRILLMLASFTVPLAGCAGRADNTAQAPVRPAWDRLAPDEYPRIAIEPSLAGVIVRGEPRVMRDDSTGVMKVVAPLRSTANVEIFVEHRTVFLDASGGVVNPGTTWRAMRLGPRMAANAEASTGRPDATDWRMEIRRPR